MYKNGEGGGGGGTDFVAGIKCAKDHRKSHKTVFATEYGCSVCFSKHIAKVKSAYAPSGPSGRRLSRFPQHEETRSISTLPWMGC